MSEPFKNLYGPQLVENLAERIGAVYPNFPRAAFIANVTPQLAPLELKGRITAIAAGLREHLPAQYPQAIEILLAILGPAHNESDGMFTDGWYLAPLATFVEHYGLDDFAVSMAAMHAITQRNTAEFAIRPFLMRYPERTLAQLRQWVHDQSFHVRRLASEGTRTRLPWGPRLHQFIADPTPVLELLEALKDDPVLHVRTSVANNLNDIAKDHPDLVVAILARWRENASPERQWLFRRALRSLVKQGHPEALRLLEANPPQVDVVAFGIAPPIIGLGETIAFSATLRSTADQAQQLIIDYVVSFPGARGTARTAVFKLKSVLLEAHKQLQVTKRHSFRPVTIRRYYPGEHSIALQVNGSILASATFVVTE